MWEEFVVKGLGKIIEELNLRKKGKERIKKRMIVDWKNIKKVDWIKIMEIKEGREIVDVIKIEKLDNMLGWNDLVVEMDKEEEEEIVEKGGRKIEYGKIGIKEKREVKIGKIWEIGEMDEGDMRNMR